MIRIMLLAQKMFCGEYEWARHVGLVYLDAVVVTVTDGRITATPPEETGIAQWLERWTRD